MTTSHAKQRAIGIAQDSDPAEAAMVINGYELRRYNKVWTARTQAGTWRAAHWLGILSIDDALDILAIRLDPTLTFPLRADLDIETEVIR